MDLPILRAVAYPGPIVTVNVGPESNRVSFRLHKELLQQKSDYFRTALRGDFAEAKENIVTLPDNSPEAFCHSVDWIYSGFVSTDHIREDASELLHAWILADKFLCYEFQNRLIGRLRVLYSTSIDLHVNFALLIYSGHKNSKITDLLMKIYALRLAKSWGSERSNNFATAFFGDQHAPEFYLRYMNEVIKAREAQAVSPFEQDICQWHQPDPEFKGSCTKDSNKRRKTGSA